MKIAHISDTHVQEGSRLDELGSVLDAFLNECQGMDLILHTGDVFQKKNNATEENFFADFARRAAEIAPLVIVKGNHDAPRDLEIFSKLETRNPIHVFERPGSVEIGDAGVIALPWFDKAHLVAQIAADIDQQESARQTIEAARQMLFVMGAQVSLLKQKGLVPILAGHILVAGSETSTGQTLIGTTVELAAGDLLDVGAAYTALGHIHMTQDWMNGRIAYAGSPIRQNHGETEDKGFRLIEIDGDHFRNDFIKLPAREILNLDVDWTVNVSPVGFNPSDFVDANLSGSLLRVRYRVRAQDMHLVDEEALRRMLAGRGAHSIKIEAVVVRENRIRSEQIVAARSSWEKVQAYWQAKGIEIDDQARDRIQAKLESIENTAVKSVAA